MVTEDECIEALEEAAERLGHSPTKPEYEELDITPSASTILRHCGSWNEAKEQAGLETNPSSGSRVQEKPDDVELPEGVEWEELTQDQRWHYANREHNKERSLERRRRLRIWVAKQKQQRGCSECGKDDPVCLEFHHRNPEEKTMKISKLVTFGHSKDSLREEIAKCDVLCVNCHRKDHARNPVSVQWLEEFIGESWHSEEIIRHEPWVPEKPSQQRAWIHQYKQICGCVRCDESNPVCLDFHHTDKQEKAGTISEMITNGCTPTELQAELNKCVVLCGNCHRREHYRGPEEILALGDDGESMSG